MDMENDSSSSRRVPMIVSQSLTSSGHTAANWMDTLVWLCYGAYKGTSSGSFTDFALDIATPPASSTAHYTFIIHPVANLGSPVFAVSLGTYNFQGSSPTDTQFFGFFPIGPVQYGDTETYNNLVTITLWDGTGQEWSTFWGEDQAGSSFNIVETLQVPSAGTSSILVRANFTCKLYHDDENGQFKQLTNGTGVFRIQNL